VSQTGQQSDSPADAPDGADAGDQQPTRRSITDLRRDSARSNKFRARRRERLRNQREERTALQRGDEDADLAEIPVVSPELATPEPADAEATEPESVSPAPAATDPVEPVASGTFRSLKIRNYRLYFTGNVICQTGTWMNRVAQDWLVLQLTDNNPIALGIATALQFGPTLLLSVWAGSLADRSDKRKLLIWIQLVLGMAAVTLGILTWTHIAQIWHVYVACLVVGTAASLDGPVRQAFVGELVGRSQISNAVALNAMGFNGARIVGPAIAGVLISLVNTGPVMTISGLSYAAVITGLIRIDPAQLRRSKPVARKKGQTREGLAYVRGRPDLIMVLSLLFMVATFGMNFQVTLAIMARIVFQRDAASYGLLSTAIAVGALLGATLAARRTQAPRQRLLIGTALGFGLLQIVLGLVGSYTLLAILLVPEGILMLAFSNAANAMVQMTTAPSMRGRVMGIYTLAFLGGTPFFSPVLGVLAEHFGGGAPLVFGGAVSALSAAVIGIWLLRTTPVHFQVRVSPVPHLHLENPDVDHGDDEHFSETVAHSLQRIGGGARRSMRPAVRIARRARRVVRRPGGRR
jgi:MFS family permease